LVVFSGIVSYEGGVPGNITMYLKFELLFHIPFGFHGGIDARTPPLSQLDSLLGRAPWLCR
jgi:hypothetical protein